MSEPARGKGGNKQKVNFHPLVSREPHIAAAQACPARLAKQGLLLLSEPEELCEGCLVPDMGSIV